MGWFDKKKVVRQVKVKDIKKVVYKTLNYHPKIILAWTKAIEGNTDLLSYLQKNGFEELAIATFAIKLDDKSRDWLMDHGYAHLMAMINACEGNEQAKKWLELNQFPILYNIAEAVDGEENGLKGFRWLKINASPDLFLLAQAIKNIKDEIEERHNDVHSIG